MGDGYSSSNGNCCAMENCVHVHFFQTILCSSNQGGAAGVGMGRKGVAGGSLWK